MPLFFFFGENQFALREKLKTYQNGFLKKYGEESVRQVIAGGKISANKIDELISAPALFSPKRFIVVSNFLKDAKTEEQKKIIKNLSKVDEDLILVFTEENAPDRRTALFKELVKNHQSEEFKPWTESQIAKWIIRKVKSAGGKISTETANYLIAYVNRNIFQIEKELEKLLSLADCREITPEMINELTPKNLATSIFDLTDSLGGQSTKKSLFLLREILESGHNDPWQVFFMLVRHFRILIMAQDLLARNINSKEIITKLKMHPFVINKAISQNKNFTKEKLSKIYKELLEIDLKIKTGQVMVSLDDRQPFCLALEKLVIKISLQ